MAERGQVLALIHEKDDLEAEIQKTEAALKAHGIGRYEPLVTVDGFPRDDIDVPAVRGLRVQLIRLENDLKGLLDEIGQKMAGAFAPKPTTSASASTTAGQSTAARDGESRASVAKSSQILPFCFIKSVLSGSVGDEVGLRADDRIVQFGTALRTQDLAATLRESTAARKPLVVVFQRPPDDEVHRIELLVPQGRSLGCHILPL